MCYGMMKPQMNVILASWTSGFCWDEWKSKQLQILVSANLNISGNSQKVKDEGRLYYFITGK